MELKPRLSDDKKISKSVTLDDNLLFNLEQFKKEKGYRKLSPKINDLLWDWLTKTLNEEETE